MGTYALFVVVAAAACGGGTSRAAGPAQPLSNSIPVAARRTVHDDLALFPVSADLVASFDLARLRQSALYRQYEPALLASLGAIRRM